MHLDNFSYASHAHSWPQRILIRAIERVSGQPDLKRIYQAYQAQDLPLEQFWPELIQRLYLKLAVHRETQDAQIPKTGPLVVVANHPYGVLDGMAICWLVAQTRPDFKILINNVLCRAPEIAACALPVDFDPTREALETNLASRRRALEILKDDGVVIVFPSGAISTTPNLFTRKAEEIEWAPLVGQLIRKSGARVVPVFFAGQNSAWFQTASHISQHLRVAFIFHEVRRRMGTQLNMVVGKPLVFEDLQAHLPPKNLARHLQTHVARLRQYLPSQTHDLV